MTTPHDSSTDLFGVWLEANADLLDGLHELTPDDTKTFYRRFKKSGVFGELLTVTAVEERLLPSDPERKVVKMRVMQGTPNGYVSCPHPLDPERPWDISRLCSSTLDVSEPLYTCRYMPMQHLPTLGELLTFNPHSLKPVTLDLPERLRLIGGETLVRAAEEAFGPDIATPVVDQVLRLKQDEVATALEALEAERAVYEADSAAIALRLADYQQQVNASTARLSEHLSTLNEMESRFIDLLSEIRAAEPPVEEETDLLPFEREKVVRTLQSLFYHNEGNALLYAEDKVELFLRAIQTNLLLILNGPSGTGKSSLVQAFADAFKGARAKIIPVQSSWTDKQDLLGYFSPSERRYVETPFLRALLDAKATDGLYLICLDEMNLSHVEYYFAEFLSLREQKKPLIPLYPESYFNEALAFCAAYEEMTETTHEDDVRYQDARALIAYPAFLPIPDNVRFVGTLNMDHTVKPLSPKVIDRSLLLELDHATLDDETIERIKSTPLTGRLDAPLSLLSVPLHSAEEAEAHADAIIDLSKGLDAIPDARINARGRKQLIRFLQYSDLNEATTDLLLQSKLLPRIHFSTRNEAAVTAFDTLSAQIAPYPNTARRIERMKDDGRYVNFFK